MSRYNTVVLSFSYGEIDDPVDDPDEDGKWSRDCEPMRQVNAWLEDKGYDPLEDLAGGWLGMNVCLFGGCYNKLSADVFCDLVQTLPWRAVEAVRVQYWDEEDETFTMIEFPLEGQPRDRA